MKISESDARQSTQSEPPHARSPGSRTPKPNSIGSLANEVAIWTQLVLYDFNLLRLASKQFRQTERVCSELSRIVSARARWYAAWFIFSDQASTRRERRF